MRDLAFLCLFIFGVLLDSTAAFAETIQDAKLLSERQVLARCFAQLTGQRLPPNSIHYQQLNGRRAVEICTSLLNDVRLGQDGLLTYKDNWTHRQILKKFNEFHKSWFDAKWLNEARFIDGVYEGTVDVFDSEEPALFLTRAVFTDLGYASTLRGAQGLRAVRDPSLASADGSASGVKRVSRFIWGSTDFGEGDSNLNVPVSLAKHWEPSSNSFVTLQIPTPLVQVGQLIGIQIDTASAGFPYGYTKAAMVGAGIENEPGLIAPYDIYRRFGGGAIGTQMFLMTHLGHGMDYYANGTTKLSRRWTEAIFKSFLCRDGGYVRSGDVGSYLRGPETGSAPFRQGTSCLRCHVTLDQAALTTRNLVLGGTTTQPTGTVTRAVGLMLSYSADRGPAAGQEPWPVTPVHEFYRQAPAGALVFRSITGNLVNRPVNSIDELGVALTETDDYYACAAKRYVERFLGVSVHLNDAFDPANSGTVGTAKEREFKEFVLDLGRELRATGSVKNMLRRIFESDYYRQADFGR